MADALQIRYKTVGSFIHRFSEETAFFYNTKEDCLNHTVTFPVSNIN